MKPISSSPLPRSRVKIKKATICRSIGALSLLLILVVLLFGFVCLPPSLPDFVHNDESTYPISPSSLKHFLPWLKPILESLKPSCSIWTTKQNFLFLENHWNQVSKWNSTQWLTRSELFLKRLISFNNSSLSKEPSKK